MLMRWFECQISPLAHMFETGGTQLGLLIKKVTELLGHGASLGGKTSLEAGIEGL